MEKWNKQPKNFDNSADSVEDVALLQHESADDIHPVKYEVMLKAQMVQCSNCIFQKFIIFLHLQ